MLFGNCMFMNMGMYCGALEVKFGSNTCVLAYVHMVLS